MRVEHGSGWMSLAALAALALATGLPAVAETPDRPTVAMDGQWHFAAAVLLLGPAASAQETPGTPPAAGAPEKAPARVVAPRVEELVRRMSDLLTASKAFALEAEEVYDEVPEGLPRIQLTSRRHVALRRPDRLAAPRRAMP